MPGLVRLTPGEVFADRYVVDAALAEGGMGTVYAVTDRVDGQRRALKVLLPELVAEERSRRRFQQEALVSGQIDTPHVPRVYASGIDDESGVPWIAMELLEGSDLRQHVREKGPLPLDEARRVLEQVGRALAAAHRRGLVHRDLKPENVFLAHTGGPPQVKLLDFGVAKVIDMHRTSATGTGAIGSPMWMSPEQTSAGGRIAPATDVWALALLAFYVLTGRFYWKAAQDDSGVAGLLRELHLDPIEPPSDRAKTLAPHVSIPVAFDAWFLRAMERDSTARWRDAGQALESLVPALQARPVDRSAMAFAQTMTFDQPELPELADDGKTTQPMAVTHLPTPEPVHEPAPSASDVDWEGSAGPTVPDRVADDVPVTSVSELPEAREAERASSSYGDIRATRETKQAVPPPSSGISIGLIVALLIMAGLGVAVLTAVIVWVVVKVT